MGTAEATSALPAPRPKSEPSRKHISFFVRCLIEYRHGVWQGFSLEFGLAVQGDSADDVRKRLERVILSYISDALVGPDREHADELLSRRATAVVYARYYWFRFRSWFDLDNGSDKPRVYREPLALEPRVCSP